MDLFDIAVGGKLCGGGGGDTPTLIDKSINANGTYNASDDEADGYKKVVANVPNTYASGDEGKVVSNGALVAQSSTTKTSNGTYDTTLNNSVTVNVPQPTGTISITQNGTGIDVAHYALADVNVSGGGGSSYELIKSEEVEVNTTSTSLISVKTVSCGESAWTLDDILFIHVHDKAGARAGYFYEYFAYVVNNVAKNAGTYDYSITSLCNGVSVNGANYVLTGVSYGVFPSKISPNGDIAISARYGSTSSRTINGTYIVDVYKLSMPNNESPFA